MEGKNEQFFNYLWLNEDIMDAMRNGKLGWIKASGADLTYFGAILRTLGEALEIAILWGDEFFTKYTGNSFNEVIKSSTNLVADDLWIFFTVTLNELKLMKEFSMGVVERVYKPLCNFLKVFKVFFKPHELA